MDCQRQRSVERPKKGADRPRTVQSATIRNLWTGGKYLGL